MWNRNRQYRLQSFEKKKLKIFTTDKEPTGAVAEFVLTQFWQLLKTPIFIIYI